MLLNTFLNRVFKETALFAFIPFLLYCFLPEISTRAEPEKCPVDKPWAVSPVFAFLQQCPIEFIHSWLAFGWVFSWIPLAFSSHQTAGPTLLSFPRVQTFYSLYYQAEISTFMTAGKIFPETLSIFSVTLCEHLWDQSHIFLPGHWGSLKTVHFILIIIFMALSPWDVRENLYVMGIFFLYKWVNWVNDYWRHTRDWFFFLSYISRYFY